jgi:two-component system, NtrC family, response regulator HydG
MLQLNKIECVGDYDSIDVDVRLITATNKNLKTQIECGVFREDFFYRINVIPIKIPPLKKRKEDIPLLVNYFIKRLRKRSGKDITGLHASVLNFFMQYPWPGNIRELKNAFEYAFVLTEQGLIDMNHLPKFEDRSVNIDNYDNELIYENDPQRKQH